MGGVLSDIRLLGEGDDVCLNLVGLGLNGLVFGDCY